MEPLEESDSIGSSSKDLRFDSHIDPQPSDLNHLTKIDEELQNKLVLKDEDDQIDDKGSNSQVGDKQLSNEVAAAPEPDINGRGFHDVDDRWNGDEQLSDEVAAAPEPDNGQGFRVDDGWNGDEQLSDDVAAYPGPDNVQGFHVDDDDGWNGDDEVSDWIDNLNEKVSEDVDEVENKDERSNGRALQYPLRPEAEDCSFYLKTGTCKFGLNCRFNHPIRRRNQAFKERTGERDELEGRSGQIECKYYSRSGGCKFGKDCKFNHTRGKCSEVQVLELNFLGLPIRLGEPECPYYMRTGSCKFGATCKFNHPDPTSVGGYDSPSFQDVSQSSTPSWSSTRKLNETPFVPIIISPSPGVASQNSDWNGYQAPFYLSEKSMHPPSQYAVNNPSIETDVYMRRHKQMPIEEFPERPGEPECSFFLKTGDCKFKSHCKFHHPKNRNARLPPCSLSDKGLPFRPGQIVCMHYSRYGICKFGPACKYDHPINLPPPTVPGLYTNSPSIDEIGGGGASEATNQ